MRKDVKDQDITEKHGLFRLYPKPRDVYDVDKFHTECVFAHQPSSSKILTQFPVLLPYMVLEAMRSKHGLMPKGISGYEIRCPVMSLSHAS